MAGLTVVRRMFVAGTVLVAALTLTTTTASATPVRGSLSMSGSPIAGERVHATGVLRSHRARPVQLQRRLNGHWVRLVRGRSNTHGRYQVSAASPRQVGVSLQLRVYAPSVRIHHHRYRAVVTHQRTVRTLAQSGALTVDQTSAVNQRLSAAATFRPARPGRWATLQQLVAGQWTTVATAAEDRSGRVSLSTVVTSSGTHSFRAVARSTAGAAPATTDTQSTTVSDVASSPTDPVISTTSLAAATVGTRYTDTLRNGDGRTGTWSVTTAALPDGLSLDGTSGVVSGTPTGTPGVATFGVTFTDANGASATATVRLTVAPAAPELPAGAWTTLSTASGTSCGIKADQTGWCWGDDDDGQVGDGGQAGSGGEDTSTYVRTPYQLKGTWLSLASSDATTCGVRTDGTGWCWGDNQSGAVGDWTTYRRTTPAQLPGSWRTLTTSAQHTCGTKADDTAWCWGTNAMGQLGDGTITQRAVPTQVPGAWSSVSPGKSATCGIHTDGTGWCWGPNFSGQVGDGTVVERHAPVQLPGTWTRLVSDLTNTCGVRTDQSGWCWGGNESGQVGNASTTSRTTPFQLPGSWRNLTLGGGGIGSLGYGDTTCGTHTDDTGWCWGNNWAGQVGDGSTTDRSTPQQLSGAWRSVDVDVSGAAAACGVRTDDTGWCWGDNESGQLGAGSTDNKTAPAQLPGTWKAVHVASDTVCGITGKDNGSCWGANWGGQVGNGAQDNRLAPFPLP